MKYYEYLLSDEKDGIEEADYKERIQLYYEFEKMPVDFFSKMRHFQPQIGCLNRCGFCSKFSASKIEYWTEKQIRNVVAALKKAAMKYRHQKPYIVWDRKEHRSGVIFSYLDNDIGNYFYLDKFIQILSNELGVKTRLSTIGYSRYNQKLNEMHRRIANELLDDLAGVRLSLTPYSIGWTSPNQNLYSRDDYAKDLANLLKIYKPYFEKYGSGNRKMCVEIRYRPLVEICPVFDLEVLEHKVISANNYLYISKEKNIKLPISKIKNAYDHTIQLTKDPILFYEIHLGKKDPTEKELVSIAKDLITFIHPNTPLVKVYQLENFDGTYYSINPSIESNGNYGINFYPITEKRKTSGYIVTERFLLNAIAAVKRDNGLKLLDEFPNPTWDDVWNVLKICEQQAQKYNRFGKKEKELYIKKEIIPIIQQYIEALIEAGYRPYDFFDSNFTIDTGIICNLGRALDEFKGITCKIDEPLTPTHERNYGKYNSTMVKENYAWRLSCGYNERILIEKLILCNTASEEGQREFLKVIKCNIENEKLNVEDLNTQFLIPGQRR